MKTNEQVKELNVNVRNLKKEFDTLNQCIKAVVNFHDEAKKEKKDKRNELQKTIIQLFEYCKFSKQTPLTAEMLKKHVTTDSDGNITYTYKSKESGEVVTKVKERFTPKYVIEVLRKECVNIMLDVHKQQKAIARAEKQETAPTAQSETKPRATEQAAA